MTEADWQAWQPSDLTPYISAGLECFGPERCMFGSDWPVCELAGSYGDVFAALLENIRKLSPAEQESVLGRTAAKFYRLV